MMFVDWVYVSLQVIYSISCFSIVIIVNVSVLAEKTQRSRRKSSQATHENELNIDANEMASKKRRRFTANIFGNQHQMNASLQLIAVPDGLISKLNTINIDIAASNRLFSSVLPTKDSSIRLIGDEKFIEIRDYAAVEVITILISIFRYLIHNF